MTTNWLVIFYAGKINFWRMHAMDHFKVWYNQQALLPDKYRCRLLGADLHGGECSSLIPGAEKKNCKFKL